MRQQQHHKRAERFDLADRRAGRERELWGKEDAQGQRVDGPGQRDDPVRERDGASMEGTLTGSFNEMTFLNGLLLDADHQLQLIEQYGGIEGLGDEFTAPHFASGWAHANNAPFQWGKQMASHLGGARDPMVVAWPTRIRPDGQVRSQFTHCIDIAPTVLEAIGLPQPTSVDGLEQEPMDGTSFVHTFDDAAAEERHTLQYFEMFGSRAIYQDGWWACARLDKAPWDLSPETMQRFAPGNYDPDKDVWELYYLPDDFSQARNLAAEQPDKVAELTQLWWQEAERNRVLPLLGGLAVMYGDLPPLPTTARYSFRGDVQNIQRGMVPRIFGRSYAIEARLRVPDGGAEGVIVANADFMGGFALWVDEARRLHHTYSFLGVETYRQVSTEPIPPGDVTVRMQFDTEQPVVGSGGRVTLWAGDRLIGEGELPKTVQLAFTSYAGLDVGREQRLGRRPRLRGQGAVCVHRNGGRGRLRPQAGASGRREGATRARVGPSGGTGSGRLARQAVDALQIGETVLDPVIDLIFDGRCAVDGRGYALAVTAEDAERAGVSAGRYCHPHRDTE